MSNVPSKTRMIPGLNSPLGDWCGYATRAETEIEQLTASLNANITVSKARDAEVQRLRSFIELCRDTFADFQMANKILGRTLQADAARAGYDACVRCLAGEKARRIGMVAMIGGKDKTKIRDATPPEFAELLISIASSVPNQGVNAK